MLKFNLMKKILFIIAFIMPAVASFSQEIPKWKITDVEKMMRTRKGEILVLNFWATFCKPCVAEIPSFIKITDKYKDRNVKLVLVSLDLPSSYPAKITTFAKEHNFNADIAWLQETNADYFCPKIDTSWSGSIPATLIYDTETGYRQFFEGEIKSADFDNALKKAIELQKTPSKALLDKQKAEQAAPPAPTPNE
jgi:thiol-disulfide isomerase/thioredoxin